jgi:hypothetical protein
MVGILNMKTLIFYVMLCTNTECTEFEPYSWNVDETNIELALKECLTLANSYSELRGVKEVDCYFED